MTFFRKRTVPPKPASLVKLAARDDSPVKGAVNSAPISDQVPLEMYAQPCSSERAGTAATAEAVSCEAGATTGTGLSPVSVATLARRGPRTVPGLTMLPRRRLGRPKLSTRGYAQERVAG